MMSGWKSVGEMIAYSDGGIVSKVLAKTQRGNVTLFCMAKGTDMSEHTSRMDGFIYVVEGRGVFRLEGKGIRMEPGVMIFMKKGAVHSLSAAKNTAFILCLSG